MSEMFERMYPYIVITISITALIISCLGFIQKQKTKKELAKLLNEHKNNILRLQASNEKATTQFYNNNVKRINEVVEELSLYKQQLRLSVMDEAEAYLKELFTKYRTTNLYEVAMIILRELNKKNKEMGE